MFCANFLNQGSKRVLQHVDIYLNQKVKLTACCSGLPAVATSPSSAEFWKLQQTEWTLLFLSAGDQRQNTHTKLNRKWLYHVISCVHGGREMSDWLSLGVIVGFKTSAKHRRCKHILVSVVRSSCLRHSLTRSCRMSDQSRRPNRLTAAWKEDLELSQTTRANCPVMYILRKMIEFHVGKQPFKWADSETERTNKWLLCL